MSELVEKTHTNDLSTDINVITAEINAYQRVAGEAIFEIGRRLKHVKENDMAHGEWAKWLDEVGMSRSQAHKFISVFERFGDVSPVKQLPSVMSVLYELTSFTDEELTESHILPDGSTKTLPEMSRREIEELKRELREVQQARESERADNDRLRKENKRLSSQAPKIETRTEYVEVEIDNTPDDYNDVKQRLEEYRSRFGNLEDYDERITATHRQDMIVAVMSFSQNVREFIKRYSYMTKYRSVIENLDEVSKRQYDEAVMALKGMADSFEFTSEDDNVIDADYSEII